MSAVKTEAEASVPALAGREDDPKDAERREFFAKLGMGSLIVAAMGTGLFTYEYFSPNVLFEPSPIIKAGKPDQFPPGTVTLDPKTRIYLINGPKGFYALSAICTHLGCLTAWKPELNLIACPCHGSRFNRDGVKVAGPAPKPLPWLKIWLSEDGYLMVDRSTHLKGEEFLRV
ncbi:MAG: ubiquinol-cytochrome c reductase iron-sulfur subunit [Actinomycetota bacterium]